MAEDPRQGPPALATELPPPAREWLGLGKLCPRGSSKNEIPPSTEKDEKENNHRWKIDEKSKESQREKPIDEAQQTLPSAVKSTNQEQNIPRRQMREREEETLPTTEEPTAIQPEITTVITLPTEQENTTQDCNRKHKPQQEGREKTRKQEHQEQM